MSGTMLSAHFSREELACPHCGACNVHASLLLALEELRAKTGPLTILSGYRCPEHNKAVGGAQASEHTLGMAADVACPSALTLPEFYAKAEQVPALNGIGVYPAGKGQNQNFLHVDVRQKRARWARVNGHYVGVEEGLKP